MDIRLKELLHNLKDRNWDVNPTYKIDENEARKIIQALDETDKKIADYIYVIGLLQDRLEAVNKWIPVSERLPEESVDVLTQYSDYSMSVDFRTASSSGWFWADKEDLPIAWMPLPEPYKAESEE